MRDDDRGAPGAQPPQRGEHGLLRDRVERGRRLVEDQDRRVLQQRAGDAEPLALAARQRCRPLRPSASRSRSAAATTNSCACAARAAASTSCVGGVEPAVADVVGDRAAEQHRVLRHDARCARAAIAGRSRRTSTPSMSTRPRSARRSAGSGWPASSCRRRSARPARPSRPGCAAKLMSCENRACRRRRRS